MTKLPDSPEDFGALMEKLGAPSSADGYVADLPDAELEAIRSAATAAKLTTAQFEKIAAARKAALQGEQERVNQAKAELAAKYGDQIEEAKIRAARAKNNLGIDVDADDPATFTLLEKLGAFMSDTPVPQGSQQQEPEVNPTEIAIEIRQIMMSEAFNDKRHEEHEIITRKAMLLREKLAALGFNSIHDARLLQGAPPSIAKGAKKPSIFEQMRDN